MKFEEFSFVPSLQKAIAEIGFIDCTPVQSQSFSAYFDGKDIFAQSQTGTGKTAAFVLCGLQELLVRNNQRNSSSSNDGELQFAGDIKMLILSPTRELAQQIEAEARLLAQFLPVQVAAFYGGVGYQEQRSHLDAGVQIITGTPGRVIDLAKSGELPLQQVQVIVLDEADRMLDMGFVDDVRWIMGKLPPASERLTMLYSATLNACVGNLTWEFMRAEQVAEIIIEPEQVTTKNVEQELYHVSNHEKLRLLLSLIKKHNPDSALIFCNTKRSASFLENILRSNGYQARALMGDLPQARRTQIVGQLKAGELRFVVATDVASRGLHIEGLPLVLNYDLPDEAENYVHRIGRTARAGISGRAISLACERYVYNLAAIERYIDGKIPMVSFPEEELVADLERSTEQRARPLHNNKRVRHSERPRSDGRREQARERSRHSVKTGPKTAERNGYKYARPSGDKQGRERERAADSFSSEDRDNSESFSKGISKDKDERLKYYQQKYGDNFGAGGGREAANSGRARSRRRSSGSRVSRAGARTDTTGHYAARGRNSKENANDLGTKPSVKQSPEKPQNLASNKMEDGQKRNLWQRLFSRKKN